METLRQEISDFLDFTIPGGNADFRILEVVQEAGYARMLIRYSGDEGDAIPAYLLLPEGTGPFAAVLLHHQHHGQRHFGKSEVCGLVGDPYQAFGPALARQGIAVLASDSICFEDRRRDASGTEPDAQDVAQHYDEMCHRLLRGDTLIRKVLDDAARGVSLLQAHPLIDSSRVGIMGHSYGGSTALFQMALDERIRFGCSSGAVSSYQYKIANKVGIEMSLAIPGFAARFEKVDLVKCIAPRPFLVASATADKYSMDADDIVAAAGVVYEEAGKRGNLEHARYEGGHPLTEERFGRILAWLLSCANKT